MTLGQRLLELRKSKQLSQEEVAFKLNVTRQTISKWETNQSTPDFDRIAPLCEIYEITPNELINGRNEQMLEQDSTEDKTENLLSEPSSVEEKRTKNMAKGISLGVFLYFVALSWIIVVGDILSDSEGVAPAIFMLICGVATFIIIYTCMVNKKETKTEKKETNKVLKLIDEILSIITLIIYLVVSFITMAWHITWIIWVVYSLISEVIKLFFVLRGKEYENEE